MKKILIILLLFNLKFGYVYSIEPKIFVQSTVNRASQVLSENISKEDKINELKSIAEETVDTKIVKSLRKKINIASKVMGEELKSWI